MRTAESLEGWEEVKEWIDSMDMDQLRLSAMMMVLRLGTAEALASIRDAEALMHDGEGPVCAPPYEEIHRQVRSVLSSAACDIDESDYRDPDDDGFDDDRMRESSWAHECAMICDSMGIEFGDMVLEILEYGGETEAQKFVGGIVKALLDRDIPWVDTPDSAMKYRKAYAEAIQERFRNKEFDTLFEEFDYDGTARAVPPASVVAIVVVDP